MRRTPTDIGSVVELAQELVRRPRAELPTVCAVYRRAVLDLLGAAH